MEILKFLYSAMISVSQSQRMALNKLALKKDLTFCQGSQKLDITELVEYNF